MTDACVLTIRAHTQNRLSQMSLKGNIILNYINTLTSIIFPVITFPYAARVLSPEGIGSVDFLNSIINYIIIFTNLGIPFYAIREIAKYRDDIRLRNKKTFEILCLCIMMAVLGYIAVYIIGISSPRINRNIDIFYILSFAIFFNAIGAQWFYQAIEDFKFITIRAIIVRVAFTIWLFMFVKDERDTLFYAVFLVGSTVSNYLINFIHLRKFLIPTRIHISELSIKPHIKPTLKVFIMFVFVSVYVHLNTILLGFLQDDKSVGYYTAGMKISRIINTLITSVGAVLLPRCSNLVQADDKESFRRVASKSYHLMMACALPVSIALVCLARPITMTLCGDAFEGSVAVVAITGPTAIFVSLSNIIGMQILFPMNKENIVITATAIASVINVAINLMFVPLFAEKGAALAIALAELSIAVAEYAIGRKYIPFKLIDRNIRQYFTGSCVMLIAILAISVLLKNNLAVLLAGSVAGFIVYAGYLCAKREEIAMEILSRCLSIIKIQKR